MKSQLNNSSIQSFKVAKVCRDHSDSIKSMDFSPSGEYLVTCGADDKIVIYDSESGARMGMLNSKKYGVDLLRLTHSNYAAIHSSTKVDNSIRYLSFYDNKYLRYFPGHTNSVTSLCVSPSDDTFISCSMDNTLRLWDLRAPNCSGMIPVLSPPVAAFDPEGLIFGVGVDSESIKLYDLRSYLTGPFATFKYKADSEFNWKNMKFSRDGKTIIMSGNGSMIRMIDAFHGIPLQTFLGFANDNETPVDASFSSDSQYILSGSVDGTIFIWNADSGYKVCVLNGGHPGPVNCVEFNPKYMMMVSACTNLAFWTPTTEQDDQDI